MEEIKWLNIENRWHNAREDENIYVTEEDVQEIYQLHKEKAQLQSIIDNTITVLAEKIKENRELNSEMLKTNQVTLSMCLDYEKKAYQETLNLLKDNIKEDKE